MMYQEYLQSADWKQKRLEKYARKPRRCAICATLEKLHVHHLVYRQLFDVEQKDLIVLCERCHFLAHDLIKAGKIVFRNDNPMSRYMLIKNAVKKHLGISKVNMFNVGKSAATV